VKRQERRREEQGFEEVWVLVYGGGEGRFGYMGEEREGFGGFLGGF
jgi:hypothetical protein